MAIWKMAAPLQCQKPKGDAHGSGEKPIQVRPITLAIATCHTEQIEFVFLRWLAGALNSVLVALLIKAVRANLFSCEPARLKINPQMTLHTYTGGSGFYIIQENSHQPGI